MNENKIVAIVGRPNVGKSRLFNRLAHRRISIVHDKPGVTRDLVSIDMPAGFTLMDTGGIGLEDKHTPKIISDAMRTQAMIAIDMADIILFVTDGKEGLTPLDMEIAESLHTHQQKVMLVVNKMDNPDADHHAYEFAKLGFDTPIPVSAEHNHGLEELENSYLKKLQPLSPKEPSDFQKIAISLVGKPNAGKSSLGNRLLNSERFIVADVAGTTRDMIETAIEYEDPSGKKWNLRLFDTAGLRPKKKMDSSVEYFSSVRTERSIKYSDIVLHLVDAREGATKQDKIIAGEILKQGKALIVVVTKWDYAVKAFHDGEIDQYPNLRTFQEAYEKTLRKAFFYLPDSPVVFTSAESGEGLEDLLKSVIEVHHNLETQIPTSKLNKFIAELFERRQPSKVTGRRFKIFYALQVSKRPFKFKVFCNRAERLQDPYRRYLEKNILREFGLNACPCQFELVGKEQRYKDEE
ncbi:MAG: ribosome biogenesis GTPase Der [Opitutales bacterium]|nr:ribosome biogenesis GTPase Der [Opitutales bacterium]